MKYNVFIVLSFFLPLNIYADRSIVNKEIIYNYVESFCASDTVSDAWYIKNDRAFDFIIENVPYFECPDKDIEKTYYFRWWTFRKHIKKISSERFVITEFLKKVGYSDKYGVINCPAGHHIYEGRWLRNPKYIKSYLDFYLTDSLAKPRQYSFWMSDSFKEFVRVHPDSIWINERLSGLIKVFNQWNDHKDKWAHLYWQYDMSDGMEMTVAGALSNNGKFRFRSSMIRPSFNSYMYGDAMAIAELGKSIGLEDICNKFSLKADTIKRNVEDVLWNDSLNFFTSSFRDYKKKGPLYVRELIGYVPWYFNLPSDISKYEIAWKELMNKKGFFAPFGPTTCEQRHPLFQVNYADYKANCLWNGPSWPFATTQTLVAMSNYINNYHYNGIDKKDYFSLLEIYTKSHRFRQIPPDISLSETEFKSFPYIVDNNRMWIDENLDPYNGNWHARYRFMMRGEDTKERGKDYNHSGYCDLIISGLVGIRTQSNNSIVINPLVPDDWEYFCLENIRYKNNDITVLWDKDGNKYNYGKGFIIMVNNQILVHKEEIKRIKLKLDKK